MPPENKRIELLSLDEWAAKTGGKVEWLWADTIPLRHISALTAKQKVGKSTLLRNLIASVVSGNHLFGRRVRQGSVIYLPLEEEPAGVRRHFRAMGLTEEEIARIVIPVQTRTVVETDRNGRAKGTVQKSEVLRDVHALQRVVENVKPALIAIDPIVMFVRFQDLNAYEKVYAALEPLIRLAMSHNSAVVFTHHEGKTERDNIGQRSIGSTALPSIVHTTISMQDRDGIRLLENEGRGIKPLGGLVIRLNDLTGRLTGVTTYSELKQSRMIKAMVAVCERSGEPETRDFILSEVEGRKETKIHAFNEAVSMGLLIHVAGIGVRNDPKRYCARSAYAEEPPEPDSEAELPEPESTDPADPWEDNGFQEERHSLLVEDRRPLRWEQPVDYSGSLVPITGEGRSLPEPGFPIDEDDDPFADE